MWEQVRCTVPRAPFGKLSESTVGYGIVIAIIVQFTANWVVSIFTDDPNVIISGGQYLRSYILDTGLASIHFCFSGFFCACGASTISFIHTFFSIVLARIPFSYLFSINYPDSLYPMGIATPIGSLVSFICVGFYWYFFGKNDLYFANITTTTTV